MKKYMKGLLLMLAGLSVFVACKDEDRTAPGEWDASPNYANIYFEGTSESHEFAPDDPTTVTLKVYRRDTIGALTVQLEKAVNTDDVFEVGPATFEDGDSVATFEVNFPKAEIGKTYTLQLTSTDPNLVSNYSAGIVYTLDVIRVKWVLLGQGTIWDAFPYTFAENSGKLDIYVREDDNSKFRLNNIFDDIATNAGVTPNGEQTTEAYLSILKKGDVLGGVTVTQADLVSYDDINTGMVHPNYGVALQYIHPVWFGATHEESNWSFNRVLDYQENGLPARIQLAPFYYMDGVGGFNWSQYNEDVIITFPGVYVPYTAVFEDDFEWADVKTFDFTNSLTGEVSNVMLQKATCTVDTDKADSVFLATYGVPYRIVDAYAEGYDLIFFVKGKTVYVPRDLMEGELYFQPTGVTAPLTATDIYAYVDNEKSSITFSEDGTDIISVDLAVDFINKDGDVLNSGIQTLNNVTWTVVGSGDYTYTAMFDEPQTDEGLTVSKRDDRDDTYRVSEWFYGVDFTFTWDKETNKCTVPTQFTGYESSNGPVYVSDFHYYGDYSYDDYPCTYDPETGTFTFYVIYHIASGGYFGYNEETLKVTFNEESATVKALAPGKQKFSLKGMFKSGRNHRAPKTFVAPWQKKGSVSFDRIQRLN